jgi:hypothetical protein
LKCQPLHGWAIRGLLGAKRIDRIEDLKVERRIIFERCTIEYNRCVIGSAPFKFYMGGKFMEQMEGGKKDDTFFSAL